MVSRGSSSAVSTRLAVEGEIPVAVGEGLDESQGGGDFVVHHQRVGVDSGIGNDLFQELAEHIVANLANESTGFAQLAEHSQHIAGRAAGAGLKEVIPLCAGPVLGKIDQQFAKGDYIILFHGFLPF